MNIDSNKLKNLKCNREKQKGKTLKLNSDNDYIENNKLILYADSFILS